MVCPETTHENSSGPSAVHSDMVLFFLRLWLKTYGVSIQIKITEQCIHIGLFVYQYFTTGKLDFC